MHFQHANQCDKRHIAESTVVSYILYARRTNKAKFHFASRSADLLSNPGWTTFISSELVCELVVAPSELVHGLVVQPGLDNKSADLLAKWNLAFSV